MSSKEAVHRLLGLLWEYKKIITMIMLCLLVSTVLSLCVPLLSRQIMDAGFIGRNQKTLIQLVLYALAIYLTGALIDFIKEKKRIDISAKIQYKLSEQSFSHLMKLKAGYFDKKNYAEILNNLNIDVNNMTSIADESVFFVLTQAFSMIGGVIGLFILDYRMTILVLFFIPIKFVITRYFAIKNKKYMDEFIQENHKYAKWFGDTVGGVREVKLFGIESCKQKEFSERQLSVVRKQKKMNMLSRINMTADSTLIQIMTTLIYIIGANLVFNYQLTVGSVFAFITYSVYVMGPISAILNIGYLLSGIIPSTKRYYEFMDLEEEHANIESTEKPEFGDIELQDMSFYYEKNKPILKNVNLIIPKGSKIAIMGQNGSGKSTIIELLLRMYEPTDGKILLSGKNISSMNLADYRGMISVVTQEIYLFNTTIRNNIALYKQVTDQVLMNICRESGLGDFIDEYSLNYEVGQNGTMLSGGQKQKIALARALICDKPVIIFDEATSSTDACSEQQICSLLGTKLKDKTVIVITHKTEILSEVEQIFVIKDGKLVKNRNYKNL